MQLQAAPKPAAVVLGVRIEGGLINFQIPADYLAAVGALDLLTDAVKARSPLRQQARQPAPGIEIPPREMEEKLIGSPPSRPAPEG